MLSIHANRALTYYNNDAREIQANTDLTSGVSIISTLTPAQVKQILV